MVFIVCLFIFVCSTNSQVLATSAQSPSAVAISLKSANISDFVGILTEANMATITHISANCQKFRLATAVIGHMDIPQEYPLATEFCREVIALLLSEGNTTTPPVALLLLSVGHRQVALCGTVTESVSILITGLMHSYLVKKQYGAALIYAATLVIDFSAGRPLPAPGDIELDAHFLLPLWPAVALILFHALLERHQRHLAALCVVVALVSAPFLAGLHVALCLMLLIFYAALRRHFKDARHQRFLSALVALRRMRFDAYPRTAITSHCGLCMGPFSMGESICTYPCGHSVKSSCNALWQSEFMRCVCPICELPIPQVPCTGAATASTTNSVAERNALAILEGVKMYFGEVAQEYEVDGVILGDNLDVSWSKKLYASQVK